MKKVLLGMIILASTLSHAGLLGAIEGKNSYVYVDIMDFQPTDTVSFELKVDGNDKDVYRHLFAYLPVDDYYELFNTENDISMSTEKLIYKASGGFDDRTISIEKRALDDSNDIAQKEIATIRIQENKASLEVKAYRRKNILFYVGDLKLVSTNKVSGLSVSRNGVGLFADNRGWPLGKVLTREGLNQATSDTSTESLKQACEIDCE